MFVTGIVPGADLGGRVQGMRTDPPPPRPTRDDLRFSNTTVILPKKIMLFIGVGKANAKARDV